MATFFPNPNDQRYASSSSATQMHYLREAIPSSYSETSIVPSSNMMMYMSYPSSSNDVPPNTGSDSVPSQQEVLSNLGVSQMGEQDFNAWGNTRGEMSFMHPMGSGNTTSLLQGVQNLQGQGLSLSLGTQIPGSGFSSFLNPRDEDNSHTIPNSMKMDVSSYGMSSVGRSIPNSKYLKAAQQLLDEVVNVRQALKQSESRKDLTRGSRDENGGSMNESSVNVEESANNNQSELSAAERQDLQNKLTKLLSMLDEVDRRYKQYFHQMQIVVSSFDVIAGAGAAKPYTALALQTISRHFRCLRDAIAGQIRLTQKSLGDQDGSANGKGVAISRLRYVDQHLKQQRALQQLGMMQQHAWRPQRGLPESSVSILRAWLFEHFLHPYPKDSEKIMLARQTGLTRSQVSNWFINARVRLWKPMVEEMYKEETGDVDMDSNSSSELAAPKPPKADTVPSDDRGEDHQQTSTSATTHQYGPHSIPSVGMVGTTTAETAYGFVRSKGQERPSMDESSLFPETFMSRAAAYDMSELGRFGGGNGVSLTLGLQHCEEGGLPLSVENHHSFITMRESDMYHAAASSAVDPQAGDFDCLDGSENRQQHRFSSSHLLHDFVA